MSRCGGELEQMSVFGPCERRNDRVILGCKQRFRNALNDRPGINLRVVALSQPNLSRQYSVRFPTLFAAIL